MEQESQEKSSLFVTVFETFGNICALNVLWIVCSIPIFTIGASTTALYSVMMKLIKKEEGKIVQSFFTAFKSNFRQATKEWLITMAILIAIAGELYFSWVCETESFSTFYMILGVVELVLVCVTLPYVFPLTAKFENTVWNTFKNAFLLSVSDPLSWVKVFLAWFMPAFICIWKPIVFFYIWYLWLIVIIGLIAYGTSFTIRKVLRRVEEAQDGKDS